MDKDIIELQKKLTFSEDAIEELKELVELQHKRIEALEKELKILRLRITDETLVRPLDEEQPPPHY